MFSRFSKPVPLVNAILAGKIRHVRKHLKRGVDPNAKLEDGRAYPLHYASHSYVDIMQLLIEHGANVNVRDENGKTPLHIAAFVGYYDGVSLLLKHGVQVNARDNEGKTPLAEATMETPLQGFVWFLGVRPSRYDLEEQKDRERVAQLLKSRGARL